MIIVQIAQKWSSYFDVIHFDTFAPQNLFSII